jgi:hypothetical protein
MAQDNRALGVGGSDMDVIFRHNGVLHQARDYIQLPCDDPSHPLVFLTPDESEVFLLCADEIGVYSIRALSQLEWTRLRQGIRQHVSVNSSGVLPRASGDKFPELGNTRVLEHQQGLYSA